MACVDDCWCIEVLDEYKMMIAGPGTEEDPSSPTRILSNVKHPAGESHVLLPLPRPANCNVASKTMGEGSARRKDGFLVKESPVCGVTDVIG